MSYDKRIEFLKDMNIQSDFICNLLSLRRIAAHEYCWLKIESPNRKIGNAKEK